MQLMVAILETDGATLLICFQKYATCKTGKGTGIQTTQACRIGQPLFPFDVQWLPMAAGKHIQLQLNGIY